MEIRQQMFADSVSSSAVQLRRRPGLTGNDAASGQVLHQVNIVTGEGAAATADTYFWATGCVLYEVIIRRVG